MTTVEAFELAYDLEPLVREEWERRFLDNLTARETNNLPVTLHHKNTLKGMAEKYRLHSRTIWGRKGLDSHGKKG